MSRQPSFLVAASLTGLWIATTAVAQAPKDYSGSCTAADCHGAYKTRPVLHSPVEQETCDACHELADEESHQFEWTEEGEELCLQCHELDEFEVQHSPVEAGECLSCHDPHGSAAKMLLIADSTGELCAECHDEITEDPTFLHGPVASGDCLACHAAHGADHARILVDTATTLCLNCHTEMKQRLNRKGSVHSPAKEGCVDCHNPHGSDLKMFTRSAVPELCLDCHDDVGDLIEDSEVTHDAVTTQRACAACHDPHAASGDSLLIAKSMALCLSCHDRPVESDGAHLLDIAGLLTSKPNAHGPIRDEDCTTCHNPHAGDTFRLLTDAYPARFYTSYDEESFALCFGCHDVEMVEEEEVEDETGFRNEGRNLHYVHVNKEMKGRTCRACHNVHASDNSKHIAESVPFGEWSIPLNFKATPTGGSCEPGCHRQYGYDRESAVDNRTGS